MASPNGLPSLSRRARLPHPDLAPPAGVPCGCGVFHPLILTPNSRIPPTIPTPQQAPPPASRTPTNHDLARPTDSKPGQFRLSARNSSRHSGSCLSPPPSSSRPLTTTPYTSTRKHEQTAILTCFDLFPPWHLCLIGNHVRHNHRRRPRARPGPAPTRDAGNDVKVRGPVFPISPESLPSSPSPQGVGPAPWPSARKSVHATSIIPFQVGCSMERFSLPAFGIPSLQPSQTPFTPNYRGRRLLPRFQKVGGILASGGGGSCEPSSPASIQLFSTPLATGLSRVALGLQGAKVWQCLRPRCLPAFCESPVTMRPQSTSSTDQASAAFSSSNKWTHRARSWACSVGHCLQRNAPSHGSPCTCNKSSFGRVTG